MTIRGNLKQLSDITICKNDPSNHVVYFIRIHSYNPQIEAFLNTAVEKAYLSGIIQEGKLTPPDTRQISYFQEIMGDNFSLTVNFIADALAKWMPQIGMDSRKSISNSLFNMLNELKLAGKNSNIIKNAYIKYMCWLYYRFSQVLGKLSQDIPLIVYQGDVSIYELQILSVLCNAGCNIILINPMGEQAYIKLDHNSHYSQAFDIPDPKPFPQNFSIKALVQKLNHRTQTPQLNSQPIKQISMSQPMPPRPQTIQQSRIHPIPAHSQPPPQDRRVDSRSTSASSRTPISSAPRTIDPGPAPQFELRTNQWFPQDNPLAGVLTPFTLRTGNPCILGNVFSSLCGVENRMTYENELSQFYQTLLEQKRHVVIVENELPPPSPDEIAKIRRGNYRCSEDMVKDISSNFSVGLHTELQKYAIHAFIKIMSEEIRKPEITLNRATNTAVFLLCWFKRWLNQLFAGWNSPITPCFIFWGACKKDKEILFLRMLARMPVDVLIISPNLNELFDINDIYIIKNVHLNSMEIEHFPTKIQNIQIMTANYQAECDMDMLSEDYAIFKNQQFSKARAMILHTSKQEIFELWKENIPDRPNFDVRNNVVNIPVLFAKISGVEQENEEEYWLTIKSLIMPETYIIQQLPHTNSNNLPPIASNISEFFRNGKLMRDRLTLHRNYPYSLLRKEMQEHILDKLQEILDQKLIRGTSEFSVISAALGLNKDILRLIQKFDFTKRSPKILIFNTGETSGSVIDAVQMALLSLIGFDILMFIPTGFQCLEQWYNLPIIVEHYVGEYQYQYRIQNFNTLGKKKGLFSRFKRN